MRVSQDRIDTDFDSTSGELYLWASNSGRILRGNWKTRQIGDWVTLDSTGCSSSLDVHIWEISAMRSRPYLIVLNCYHIEVLDKTTLARVRIVDTPDQSKVFGFVLSPNEEQLVVTSQESRDNWTASVYDTTSWTALRKWSINNASFTADGQQVATLIDQRQDPSSRVFDECGVAFYDVRTGEKVTQWVKSTNDPGHVCPGGNLYFRKDHPGRMVTDDFPNSAVSEWDMQTGALLQHLVSDVGAGGPPPGADCMSLSYDGDLVAIVRTRHEVGTEYGFTIWNLQSGKVVYEIPLKYQDDPVRCVRFSSNGTHIAFVHSDRVEIYEY